MAFDVDRWGKTRKNGKKSYIIKNVGLAFLFILLMLTNLNWRDLTRIYSFEEFINVYIVKIILAIGGIISSIIYSFYKWNKNENIYKYWKDYEGALPFESND